MKKLTSLTTLFLVIIGLTSTFFTSCKTAPLNIDDEAKIYNKPVHPREYYFDLYQDGDAQSLKKNKQNNKLFEVTIDFTDYVEKDMPQAGDKLIFQYHLSPTRDITGNILACLHLPESPSKDRIIASNLKKHEETKGQVSFILPSNLKEVKLTLRLDTFNKYVFLSFDIFEVGHTTDLKRELKEEKRALRKGYEIRNKETVITSDYEGEEVYKPIVVPEVSAHPATEENKEATTKTEKVTTTDSKTGKSIVKEVEVPVTTPEISEAEQKKIDEEKRLEEMRALEEQKKRDEAEKARLEKEKLEREAKEAEERRIQEEKAKQEEELKRQQQLLEETLMTVANSNDVPRYEKEYLDDYAVDNYTFDMDVSKKRNPTIFPDPNERDEFNTTLLMQAAKTGNDWQIKALVNANADVNLQDNDGWTALMYAVRYQGNMDCVELLLNAGANVKIKNNFGMSALVLAANYNNNPEIIKKLLSYYSPTDKDVLKSFVLVLTENTEKEIMQLFKVNLFLDMSVPLNSPYEGKTPLMYAAESGNSTEVIKLLLDNNSITTLRSTEGKTAFDYAKNNPKLKHDDIYWSLNNK